MPRARQPNDHRTGCYTFAGRAACATCRRSPTLTPARGLTLLELLLVLALIVIIFSLTAPRLSNLSRRHDLESAAVHVRTALMNARLDAMRSGHATLFLFRPETGFYATVATPFDEASQARMTELVSLLDGLDPTASMRGVDDTNLQSSRRALRRLPSEVTFVTESFSSLGGAADFAGATNSPSSSTSSRGASSSGVLTSTNSLQFEPDGTTFDAILSLTNASGNEISVTLRGLTGLATVQEVSVSIDSTGGQP